MQMSRTVSVMASAAVAIGLVALSGAVPPKSETSWSSESHGAWLRALEGQQSQSTIDSIMNGGGEVQALVDPDTGAVLAAIQLKPRPLLVAPAPLG